MKNTVSTKSRFAFIKEFGLLINQIDPKEVVSPSGYILNMLSLLDEAKRIKASGLLVIAPSEVYQLNFKMHDWVAAYLIPQMNETGIKRIAFCVNKLPEQMDEQKEIFGCNPEIGVFTSMPRAKAWILGVSDKPEGIPVNYSQHEIRE